jgi:hypothetical protein
VADRSDRVRGFLVERALTAARATPCLPVPESDASIATLANAGRVRARGVPPACTREARLHDVVGLVAAAGQEHDEPEERVPVLLGRIHRAFGVRGFGFTQGVEMPEETRQVL